MNGEESLILQGGAIALVLLLVYNGAKWIMQRFEQLLETDRALSKEFIAVVQANLDKSTEAQQELTKKFVETVQNHIAHSTEAQLVLKDAICELTRELRETRRERQDE